MYDFKTAKSSSHQVILEMVKGVSDQKLRVLDLGCSRGYLGRELKKIPDVYLVGVDCDGYSLEEARPYYNQVVLADLEKELPLPAEEFNLFLLGDILEHLRNPEGLLGEVRRLAQGPNSYVIISVPNVANLYIRLRLLFGSFPYAERGILDGSHLRFFTAKSLKDLLKKSGLQTVQFQAIPIPLDLALPQFLGRFLTISCLYPILVLTAKIWPSLCAYQFVVLAKVEI